MSEGTDKPWDAIVVGAGAAGLFAAIRSAERGRRTLLLEKNRRPGIKILMSGGTRCNITHACDNRGIVAAFGKNGKFLHSSLAQFGVQETLDFFHTEGVATKVEETGKIFPVSDRASDVLDALVRRLERSGAVLSLEEPLIDVQREGLCFVLRTSRRTLHTPRLVLTTGGKSYPGSGTTGDGYAWAERFGHRIVPLRPALAPITTNDAWVKELQGLTIPHVGLAIFEASKKIASHAGSLLFAHFGLSGPVALDVSREVAGHPQPASLRLEIDVSPQCREQDLDEALAKESLTNGKKLLASVFPPHVPRRLIDAMLSMAELPLDRKAAGLSKDDRRKLAGMMKRLPVAVSGTLGYKKAEVTAGGVSLDEVDSRTMESKLVPGLHFAGEILDLDGRIGGFNFQAAWSTGWAAGSAV
jgi:predicted Rossmann fold flavoprotein